MAKYILVSHIYRQMLSLLSKICLKYKKIIITSLKLHQIPTNQSITYQNYIWTKHIIFQKEKTQPKIPTTALAEAATAPAEAATAPAEITSAETTFAEIATAPAVVPEIEGSHKDYVQDVW